MENERYDRGKNFERIAEENVVFFFFFERFCICLVVQLSPIPLHFPLDCTVLDRETFTPEYDAEVQFNFAIIAKLRMNSNKSYEAVRCQLTCNFVLAYWTSSAKTAFEEKDEALWIISRAYAQSLRTKSGCFWT